MQRLTAALERALLYDRLIQPRERSEGLLLMLVLPAIADAREATLFADLADFTDCPG